MGECHNCRTGKQIMIGDKIHIDRGKYMEVYGWKYAPIGEGPVVQDYRIALVTIFPGSIVAERQIINDVFYQLEQ